ncbi:MAG: MCE family protein, partial [Solirubrobacterales bacterium]|nr:MCE family protein [Solirubrobacterales bacterium]
MLAIAAVLVAAAALVLRSGSGDGGTEYRVELDNAFGLTTGADLRADGVRVGSVKALDVDARTAHAVATVAIEDDAFAGFRRDVSCTIKPQSLIGEYFMDCSPGRDRRPLPDGATIARARTSGTIPPDLVADVLRRPYRERLGLLIAELGAGVAARGPDLDQAIRRAVPALRETDRVLGTLATERRTLRELTRDADAVLARLADGREDVSRFVGEARDTAQASALRRGDLAASIRRLPAFERELTPTLRALGTVAREQTPALQDLRAASGDLTTLLDRLGPFADKALPAVKALGEASRTGRSAVSQSRGTVAELRKLAAGATGPARNLRFILEDLDDRDRAVEPNAESPGGKGFTGLEAFLQYPFVQSQAINLFDLRGYTLKLNLLVNECTQYMNANGALRDPERAKRCSSALGPGAPVLRATPEDGGSARKARSRSKDGGDAPAPAAP